jgi:hypothetical protein
MGFHWVQNPDPLKGSYPVVKNTTLLHQTAEAQLKRWAAVRRKRAERSLNQNRNRTLFSAASAQTILDKTAEGYSFLETPPIDELRLSLVKEFGHYLGDPDSPSQTK